MPRGGGKEEEFTDKSLIKGKERSDDDGSVIKKRFVLKFLKKCALKRMKMGTNENKERVLENERERVRERKNNKKPVFVLFSRELCNK